MHWSPALRSVLSDIEVDHLEVAAGKKFLDVPSGKALVGQMFDVAYRVDGMEDQWVTVSTTRPETILGMYLHPYSYYHFLEKKSGIIFWKTHNLAYTVLRSLDCCNLPESKIEVEIIFE